MTTPGDARPSGAAPSRQPLQERYGVRSPRDRRVLQVSVAAVALAFLAWLGWAAWDHSHPDVTGQLHGYDVVSPHQVRVVIDITRTDGQHVVCDVLAQAEDHSAVGETQVAVRAGGADTVQVSAVIRTDREATTATVSNCRAAD